MNAAVTEIFAVAFASTFVDSYEVDEEDDFEYDEFDYEYWDLMNEREDWEYRCPLLPGEEDPSRMSSRRAFSLEADTCEHYMPGRYFVRHSPTNSSWKTGRKTQWR